MKCQGKLTKILLILTFGVAAFAFSKTAMDNSHNRREAQIRQSNCFSLESAPTDLGIYTIPESNLPSEPLDRVFQLIFILFFISPPLIVIMLFLIWKELKNRNKVK
jgi:hypothetical protein